MHTHKRWRLGPFARGAYGSPEGGFTEVLGIKRSWVRWDNTVSWNVWHLAYWQRADSHSQFGIASLEVKFRRAMWRTKTVWRGEFPPLRVD